MAESSYAYVYVCTSTGFHYDRLLTSIRSLRKFSTYPIYIISTVTLPEVNASNVYYLNVDFDNINDEVKKSRLIKTSLNKHLNMNKIYCYLDVDIIVCSHKINSIFNYRKGIINFCQDVSSLEEFSDAAYYKSRDPNLIAIEKQFDKIQARSNQRRSNLINRFIALIASNNLCFTALHWFSKRINKRWYSFLPCLEYISYDFRYSRRVDSWFHQNFNLSKSHYPEFKEELLEKYSVTDFNLELYNSGVFLFDNNSREFLNYWHLLTKDLFKHTRFKTKDQTSLYLANYSFRSIISIPEVFNYQLGNKLFFSNYIKNLRFTDTDHVVNIHMYNNWFNRKLPIWKDIYKKILKE